MEGRGCRPDLAYCVKSGHPCDCGDDADAVLAELRLEQVAFMRDDSSMMVSARGSLRGTEPPEGWVPVYIMARAFLAEQENTD